MFRILLLAGVFACLLSPAEARQRHATGLDPMCNITMPCVLPYASTPKQVRNTRGKYLGNEMGIGGPVQKPAVRVPKPRQSVSYGDPQIVSHPTGCPARAFCACGAAVRVGLGATARSLWLAANWFKFPRAAPAPGMAAVRRHHVMVLEADLGNGIWEVYDANSGRHMTRIHARSIAGYAIVNPR